MQVYAKTDEGDVGQIRPGHSADFQVDAFPKEVFHGVVRQVRMNATTVQNVVTYDTIVDFDNPRPEALSRHDRVCFHSRCVRQRRRKNSECGASLQA